jgi:hypothetical protein
MKLNEMLNDIEGLRSSYKTQSEAFKAGKGEAPSIKESAIDLMERMARNAMGDYSKGRASIQEALTTTDAVKLIPKVIEGQLREAAEPQYLGTNFMKTITVDGGNSAVYVIPVVGELRAFEVNEGGRYNETALDFNSVENSALEVRVKKIGVRVSITEECIQDSSWDILGLNVRKMGQAMGRYKEEWIFNTFSTHGHIVFDNDIRASQPAAGTTGLGKSGAFNDTMSVEDMLDMVLAIMGNGFVPTDIIMHPLTWVIFARNSMIGNGLSFGAFGGNNVSPWGTIQGTNGPAGLQNNGNGQALIMRPEQVQNRLPVPLTVNFSPFTRFDKVNKRFDMYCIDRAEVGVIVQREGLTTDNWTDPERDIRALKAKERYGVGILNNGRAITVAKNIAVDVSYPETPVVHMA